MPTHLRKITSGQRQADVLVHEATYAQRDEELANRCMHSTSVVAARVASAAKVKQLILTYFSPRYDTGSQTEPDDLLREARVIFPNTETAYDFMTVEAPRRLSTARDPLSA